jgi:hypothetical protein
MVRRVFCKLLLVFVAVFSFLAFSGVLYAQGRSEEALEHAKAVQERHTDALMAKPDVLGTAIGLNDQGKYVVMVLLEKGGVPGIPEKLDDVSVRPVVTGKIYARADTTSVLSRPVPIGVSTGNEGECSSGTIGCRVTDGHNVYALSNNHVYALENNAPLGSNVLQPGLYDTNCQYNAKNAIGTLDAFEPIDFSRHANNVIDAAIASTDTSLVGNMTPGDGYGTPSSTIATAALDMSVQKYGRTTGLTQGQVTGINATVLVSYGYGKTARFVNQIVITPGSFSAAGDSGSLIVDMNKNPVGLLFAGSSSDTIANPIDDVLSYFGVTIDNGSSTPPPSPGSISGTVRDSVTGNGISGATVTTDTGQSATTDNGAYTISGVPTGTHSVTASATGYQSQTQSVSVDSGQTTTGVDFSLTPSSTATTVSVIYIDYATSGGKTHDKNLQVTLTLKDNLGDPVSGASVSITLANSTTKQSWSGSATTGSSGTVTFALNNAPLGTYTTTINNVYAAGLTWDGISPVNTFTK